MVLSLLVRFYKADARFAIWYFPAIRAIVCRVAAAPLVLCRSVAFSDLLLMDEGMNDQGLRVFGFAGSNPFSPVGLFEEIYNWH